MTVKRKPYNTYPKEFKLEVLRMMEDTGRRTSEIAMELGIKRTQLYKWKEQMAKNGDVSSARKGRPKKEDQSETARLRQENKRLKEENEILKKAALSSTSQRNTFVKLICWTTIIQRFSWSLI